MASLFGQGGGAGNSLGAIGGMNALQQPQQIPLSRQPFIAQQTPPMMQYPALQQIMQNLPMLLHNLNLGGMYGR